MCQINFYSRDCQIKFLLVMEVTLANYIFLLLPWEILIVMYQRV